MCFGGLSCPLPLLRQAHSNAEIAEIVVVAESTVKTHVSSITAKVGVSSWLKGCRAKRTN